MFTSLWKIGRKNAQYNDLYEVIFDSEYYIRHTNEPLKSSADPITHYRRVGWKRGLSPSPLFNVPWYLSNLVDEEYTGGDPLRHFFKSGCKGGHKPNPLFDPLWVSKKNGLSPDQNTLAYYLTRNERERVDPHPLFSGKWYYARYPDVAQSGIDPLSHFLMAGWKEGRAPNKLLDAIWGIRALDDCVTSLDLPKEASGILRWEKGCDPYSLPSEFLATKAWKDIHKVWAGTPNGPVASFIDISQKATVVLTELSSLASVARSPQEAAKVVVYDSHNFQLEGAPNSLFEIAKGMRNRENTKVFALSDSPGPLVTQYQREGIDCMFHGMRLSELNTLDDVSEQVDRLAGLYKAIGAHIVHANTALSFRSVLAGAKAGIPVVWNIRESEDPGTYFDFLAPEVRSKAYSCFHKASAFVFVAKTTAEIWKSHIGPDAVVYVVPNSLDIGRFMSLSKGEHRADIRRKLGLSEQDVFILNVGTVMERKGQLDLAQALNYEDLCAEEKLRVLTVFVGMNNSEYAQELSKCVAGVASANQAVSLLNVSASEEDRHEVVRMFSAADIFVLCSRYESYPRVILEAMASELAIITTPCFGVVEQVINNESALYYSAGDHAALAAALKALINNQALRKSLAKAARERFEKMNSYEDMLLSYVSVYRNVSNAWNGAADLL